MQATLHLEPGELAELDRIAAAGQTSADAVIASAVREFLTRRKTSGIDRAFGLWKDMAEDGLAYQQRMRAEWDREWDR